MVVNVSVVKVVSTIHDKKIHVLSLLGIDPKEMLRDGHKDLSSRMAHLSVEYNRTKPETIDVSLNRKLINYMQNTELQLRTMFLRTFNNVSKYNVIRKQNSVCNKNPILFKI